MSFFSILVMLPKVSFYLGGNVTFSFTAWKKEARRRKSFVFSPITRRGILSRSPKTSHSITASNIKEMNTLPKMRRNPHLCNQRIKSVQDSCRVDWNTSLKFFGWCPSSFVNCRPKEIREENGSKNKWIREKCYVNLELDQVNPITQISWKLFRI